jgi:hypothetical protein
MYVNGGCVITIVNIYKSNLIMEETFHDKGVIEILTREGNKACPFIQLSTKLKP